MDEQKNINAGEKSVTLSKRKWFWLGILVALANPIFAGLIIGAVYLSEPELKNEGKIVAGLAIVWGAILYFLLSKSQSLSLFNL
jgi:hypothetical protein